MDDENWRPLFSYQEIAEIHQITKTKIDYPPLPNEMKQFLKEIPNTTDLNEIYDHLEARHVDIRSEAPLAFLKFCFQSAILLINSNYFMKARKERDICSNVWHIFGKAFNGNTLSFAIEEASKASKENNCKKRKMSANGCMERQESPLIPDMTVSQGEQEYAIIEASRSNNDTKQINDGGKKCPELMVHIFNQLLTAYPTEQRAIKIHGCLLSHLDCTPLELSNPKGYVKIFKRGKAIKHSELPLHFKPRMTSLLAYIWQFRLAVETVCQSMAQAENQQSEFD